MTGQGPSSPALLAGALAGALVGGLVALAVVRVGQPGTQGEAAQVDALLTENDALRAQLRALEARLAAVEKHPDPGPALESVAAGLVDLRDHLRGELALLDSNLRLLSERLENTNIASGGASAAVDRELTEEERERWAATARDSPDAGVRFSALNLLGRHRSDRGVQAAIERLEDPEEVSSVLWQALQNLGQFKERSAAVAVARLLDHGEPVVRVAAFNALRSMGAPESGFDPMARAADREAPMADLREWADQND